MSKPVVTVQSRLTDSQIADRVREVNEYEVFSVFSFRLTSLEQQDRVLDADGVIVRSVEGSSYIGYVEDSDDSHYYVNLR